MRIDMRVSRSMLVAVMLCFLLPFMTVSCGSVTATITGSDFLVGGAMAMEMMGERQPSTENAPVRLDMIASFLAAGAALIVSFLRVAERAKIVVLAASGLIGVLGFAIFNTAVAAQAREAAAAGMLVETSIGFQLAWLIFAAILGLHSWMLFRPKENVMAAELAPVASGQPNSAAIATMVLPETQAMASPTITCPSCNQQTLASMAFCSQCGVALKRFAQE